ncbi:MAG: CaiB/BaiF CoA-transferase family protein, partial [Pseudomonadota bacterium]
ITAGILAALGIVAAVNHRHKTGRGQMVESSLFEAAIMHTFWQSAMTFATGQSPQPMGSAHPLDGPYQAFAASDGWIVVGAANQANWLRLIKTIHREDLGAEPRFATNPDRMQNLPALVEALTPVFEQDTKEGWLSRLNAAGVPCAPVLTTAEMHADPQAIARDMIASVRHTALGDVATLGSPIKFSETPGSLGNGAPLLGEHTRDVLTELGFSDAEIADLIAAGAATAPNETVS